MFDSHQLPERPVGCPVGKEDDPPAGVLVQLPHRLAGKSLGRVLVHFPRRQPVTGVVAEGDRATTAGQRDVQGADQRRADRVGDGAEQKRQDRGRLQPSSAFRAQMCQAQARQQRDHQVEGHEEHELIGHGVADGEDEVNGQDVRHRGGQAPAGALAEPPQPDGRQGQRQVGQIIGDVSDSEPRRAKRSAEDAASPTVSEQGRVRRRPESDFAGQAKHKCQQRRCPRRPGQDKKRNAPPAQPAPRRQDNHRQPIRRQRQQGQIVRGKAQPVKQPQQQDHRDPRPAKQ